MTIAHPNQLLDDFLQSEFVEDNGCTFVLESAPAGVHIKWWNSETWNISLSSPLFWHWQNPSFKKKKKIGREQLSQVERYCRQINSGHCMCWLFHTQYFRLLFRISLTLWLLEGVRSLSPALSHTHTVRFPSFSVLFFYLMAKWHCVQRSFERDLGRSRQ